MPIQSCQSGGKPGYKWGSSGKCYTYTAGDEKGKARALRQAKEQSRAILFAQKAREKKGQA